MAFLNFWGVKIDKSKYTAIELGLGEIEAEILQHPAIREVVVAARTEDVGPRLVAYVVFKNNHATSIVELNAFLRLRLPEYMLPKALVPLTTLPLTANGKVDHRCLPAPSIDHLHSQLPSTATEKVVAEILCDLLKLESLDVRDDFFSLGGDSLSAVALVIRLKTAFGVELPYAQILAESLNTVELSRLVEEHLACGKHCDLSLEIGSDRLAKAPLSYHQQQLWVVNFLEQDRARYNVPLAYAIEGDLNIAALRRAFSEIVGRHDILRTVYDVVDSSLQQRVVESKDFQLNVIDLQAIPQEDCDKEYRSLAREFATQAFDLFREIPIRAAVYQLGRESWRLVIVVHHIAIDGRSVDLLHRELSALYTAFRNGLACPLRVPPHQYANFSVWQHQKHTPATFLKHREYWQQYLSGDLTILDFPNDAPLVAESQGNTITLQLDQQLLQAARNFSTANQTTLFTTLLAAIKATLYRYTGQEDIVVGTAVSTRDQAATEDLFGYCINVLPLRTQLSGRESFAELLKRVRSTALDALAHKDYPFEMLKKEVLSTLATGQDIIRVMFVLEDEPTLIAFDGASVRSLPLHNQTAKFDLLIAASEGADHLRIDLEYRCDRFTGNRIEQFGTHLKTLLSAAVSAPNQRVDRLPLLTKEARKESLTAWNPTGCINNGEPMQHRAAGALPLVHDLVSAQAKRTPNALALRFEDAVITYSQLDQRASVLASKLVQMRVGTDVPVVISIRRSPEMIIAVLGVLRAGGAYVPLDPTLPQLRQKKILGQCNPKVVLTQSDLANSLELAGHNISMLLLDEIDWQSERDASELPLEISRDNLAYILYTSGSTGEPKGVAMPHGAIANLIDWQLRNSSATLQTRTLQFASLGFDVSFQEIFATLCSGGELILCREETQSDLNQLWKLISSSQVERIFVPYVALRSLCEIAGDSAKYSALREVVTAGERLQITPTIREFFQRLPACRLWNHYGPTETHVVTAHCLSPEASSWPANPTIGLPIDHCVAVLLDDQLQPVPQGIDGELYLGGDCLARGYYQRDELTNKSVYPESI